jgi:hypothetical protein
MAVKDSDTFEQSMMKMFDSLYERHPEFLDQILAKCPTEKRVAGLPAEELLRVLSPEERERLKQLLH